MDQEVKDILQHIQQNHHFLLSGGAGSGKTYSMVQTIRAVLEGYPGARIACMTYTNAAANEIDHRINDTRLTVSTIHDFLWDNIQNYQKELKKAVIELSKVPESKIKSKDYPGGLPDDYYDNQEESVSIEYKEYVKLSKGKISHDEVLAVAQYLFQHSPRLVDVVKSRYQFIFIDEYQDTHTEVIDILLNIFPRTPKPCHIGFFGDSMQAIYETGVGDINGYMHTEANPDGIVYEVKKTINRRCPQTVITLANQLRNDGLVQVPLSAEHVGTCRFFYADSDDENKLKARLVADGWDFTSNETKELRLTHNLISAEAGFRTLLEIHSQDPVMGYRNRVRDFVNTLMWDCSSMTFGEVLDKLEKEQAGNRKKWEPTTGQRPLIEANKQWLDYAKGLNYEVFLKCYASKEQLIDDKNEDTQKMSAARSTLSPLMRHLFQIEEAVRLYQERNYNEFVRKTNFKSITRFQQKSELKKAIETIRGELGDARVCNVLDIADKLGICIIDDKLTTYRDKNPYIYKRVEEVSYSEVRKVYDYLVNLTPFSTQHKTKGLEYDNVLILLNNGKWTNYNFASLFMDTKSSETVKQRTRKLFYVCCTRAKKNLAVFYPTPEPAVVEGAKSLFGDDNVIKVE